MIFSGFVCARDAMAMRWFSGALVVLSLVSPAAAGDLDLGVPAAPFTVGPATFSRWSGFYFGGQIGLSNANADFSGATKSLVAFALRDTLLESEVAPSQWQVLGNANQSAASYGGFVGYNTQWQDLVLGMEANFNRANFSLHASTSPIGRTTSDSAGNAYSLSITGSGSVVTQDFATMRLRAGWVVGNFLPYAFAGLALGIADTSVSATINGKEYTSGVVGFCPSTSAVACPIQFPNPPTSSTGLNNAVLYGFTIGGGIDVALTQNVFLRAEFEFDQFKPPPNILMSVATGRIGGGFNF